MSGYYRMSVYFSSKLIFEVLPMKALPAITFCTVTYWMIGTLSCAKHEKKTFSKIKVLKKKIVNSKWKENYSCY